jgi:hypothetical protein
VSELNDLLALLPDNSSGEISAADLRTIVTELYNDANSVFNQYAYKWDSGTTPASGKLNLAAWTADTDTTLYINDVSAGSIALPFGLVDTDPKFTLARDDGTAKASGTVIGPSVPHSGYHEVPVHLDTTTGTSPTNNTPLTLSLMVTLT